jgi:chromosomal replication initiation ATPase DnaA
VTIWDEVLAALRPTLPDEDFRRWFGETAYASDSGDQITVWVTTAAIRRHILTHFLETVHRALASIGREGTVVRFVVGGTGEDEEDE